MCTALHLEGAGGFFGRTLDVEQGYGEQVCITPRQLPFHWRHGGESLSHHALIGTAVMAGVYPLYFEAANEAGLAMAGLNFPGSACYLPPAEGCRNVCSFELIPYVLGQCATVAEARALLAGVRVVDTPFAATMPTSPLHWMVADATDCIVAEPLADGLAIYDNPYGVMTNNPPWEQMAFQPKLYAGLTNQNPPKAGYACLGLGAVGLPGDLSSASRLARVAFHRRHAEHVSDEAAGVGQMFHLLSTVIMPRGSCLAPAGHPEYTRYICGISQANGRYYYSTHDNRRLNCVDLHRVDLDGTDPFLYQMAQEPDIAYQN